MATDPLQLQLTTLTPIWTGGADGKSDRLHVTGIMGSLRWWYEVFVRSVGGTACDPTEHSCIYDKSSDSLCDVCRVFGATGWSRRFKLVLSETSLQQKKPSASSSGREGNLVFNLSSDHPSSRSQGHRWYLPGEPLYGQTQLTVIPTAPSDKSNNYFDPNILGSLLQFIADRA
ncbi:MAG: type III-B CRISPR module RAMP protein Cmr1, partial [Ktedonobacteraceae bacterium]